MSDGNAHNLNNLPIIHAGGLNGYFKTGQAVNVDTANTGSANVVDGQSESQCANGTGHGQRHQPGHRNAARSANAPINKYYYNIMNAMGVKADANGYPLKGGTARSQVRLLRQDGGLRRRLRRQARRGDSQPLRVHRGSTRAPEHHLTTEVSRPPAARSRSFGIRLGEADSESRSS
jgi:hypothetical protein